MKKEKTPKKRTKKKYFTVAQAAKVMGCHTSSIYRLLAEGKLNGPVGPPLKGIRAKRGKSARISQKSLFQLMVIDSTNPFNGRPDAYYANQRKNFKKLFAQNLNVDRLSKRDVEKFVAPEAAPEAPPAPKAKRKKSSDATQ